MDDGGEDGEGLEKRSVEGEGEAAQHSSGGGGGGLRTVARKGSTQSGQGEAAVSATGTAAALGSAAVVAAAEAAVGLLP